MFKSECTIYSVSEFQGTPWSKQAPYLTFKWQQRDWNPQPLSSETNTQPFSQTGQMIELCSEYLLVWCMYGGRWLYVIIMSRASFRVNLHAVVCRNVKKHLAQSRRYIWILSDSDVTRTHNHLVRKRTLNHLAKLAKWLSCVVSTFLYGAFDCMLLSQLDHLAGLADGGLTLSKEFLDIQANYRVWIHSETRTWHDNKVQSNAPYRQVLTTQLNHLASLTKWLSIPLRTK